VITFTVLGPMCSTNQAYRRRGHSPGMFITPEGLDFKARIMLAAKKAMRGKAKLIEPCFVNVIYFRPSKRGDVDGPGKFVLDAMEGIVYENDSVVTDFTQQKRHDPKDPRTVVVIFGAGGEV
jgi:Holliday junction resolvase RusA-like endonuclease